MIVFENGFGLIAKSVVQSTYNLELFWLVQLIKEFLDDKHG